MKEETIDSKVIYTGKILTLKVDTIRLPNGKISEREVVERINGVSVLPVANDYNVMLIRQYRYAAGKMTWRFPGGGIDPSDKTPEEAAQRELFEEIGYKAKKLELLFESGGSGAIRQKIYHYLASGLYTPKEERHVDDGELLEIVPVSLEQALKMAHKAEFPNPAFSLMIILAADRFRAH